MLQLPHGDQQAVVTWAGLNVAPLSETRCSQITLSSILQFLVEYRWIGEDPGEPHAGWKFLALDGTVIFPVSFERSRARMTAGGFRSYIVGYFRIAKSSACTHPLQPAFRCSMV